VTIGFWIKVALGEVSTGVSQHPNAKSVCFMCDRASYMQMSGTNLMQQLWFIFINISTCCGHLYFHLQECRLYVTAYGRRRIQTHTQCTRLHTGSLGPQPQHPVQTDTNSHTVHNTTHRLLRTTATTPSAEHHTQQNTTCTPEDGHIDGRNM